LGFKFPQNRQK